MTKSEPHETVNRPLSQSAGYLFSQISRLYSEGLSKALSALELSLYEYGSLRLISFNTPLSQGDLGDRYGIDRTTMVSVIDGLEGRGMVTRERSKTDRRRYRLLLTAKGKKVLSRALRVANIYQQRFLKPLSSTEWESVRSCLWRLLEANGTLPPSSGE
jgi:DNA-binding MarR family transcriptional regulator